MTSDLKRLDCVPDCGFAVVSHDENEIVNIGLSHVSNFHDGKYTPAEIKQLIKLA